MIITIARQCGCGAANVGKLLSKHYGIPFYTRKNLLEMADKRGMLDEMESFLMNVLSMSCSLPFLLLERIDAT